MGVERERSRNLKAFWAAMDRADLSLPRPGSLAPSASPPSAAAPSVSLLLPIAIPATEPVCWLFQVVLEALVTVVKELECELPECPELTSITPSCVPPELLMMLCCLGGTAGPLLIV